MMTAKCTKWQPLRQTDGKNDITALLEKPNYASIDHFALQLTENGVQDLPYGQRYQT